MKYRSALMVGWRVVKRNNRRLNLEINIARNTKGEPLGKGYFGIFYEFKKYLTQTGDRTLSDPNLLNGLNRIYIS